MTTKLNRHFQGGATSTADTRVAPDALNPFEQGRRLGLTEFEYLLWVYSASFSSTQAGLDFLRSRILATFALYRS